MLFFTSSHRRRAAGGSVGQDPAKTGLDSLGLMEVWEHRELLYFLVWRNVKVRYKQTALGAAWAILQPILGMFVSSPCFSVV